MPKYETYEYKPRKDSGSLRSNTTKRSEKSPDYWGDIAIDLRDQTNFRVVDGLTIVKVNGWKRQDRSGKSYLSLAVDRYVAEERPQSRPAQKTEEFDDDVPF